MLRLFDGTTAEERPEDSQEAYEVRLHNMRLGMDRGARRDRTVAMPRNAANIFRDTEGYSRWRKELAEEVKDDSTIQLSREWAREVGLTHTIVDALFHQKHLTAERRDVAKEAILTEARMGMKTKTPPSGGLPDGLGTVEDFRRRWLEGELDIFVGSGGPRRSQVIKVRSTGLREHLDTLPPDPDDDLDPADGPPGHWEGLRWISDALGGLGTTPETPGS